MERLTHALVRALAERALGTAVTGVAVDTLGGSNAVFFLDLRGGDRCVLRVSPPGQADLVAQEAWALGAAGRVGVPTPAVLVADTSLRHLDRPYLLLRWLPGVPAFRAPLAPGGRAAVLAQLGQHLARLHGLALDGFGPLRGGAGTYASEAASWWGYIRAEGARRLARLPGTALPPQLAHRVARHLAAAAAWRAPVRAVLVHGDLPAEERARAGCPCDGHPRLREPAGGRPAPGLRAAPLLEPRPGAHHGRAAAGLRPLAARRPRRRAASRALRAAAGPRDPLVGGPPGAPRDAARGAGPARARAADARGPGERTRDAGRRTHPPAPDLRDTGRTARDPHARRASRRAGSRRSSCRIGTPPWRGWPCSCGATRSAHPEEVAG